MKVFAHARSRDDFQFMAVDILDGAQWPSEAQYFGAELQWAVKECDDGREEEKSDCNNC